jgi:hypothetical protein
MTVEEPTEENENHQESNEAIEVCILLMRKRRQMRCVMFVGNMCIMAMHLRKFCVSSVLTDMRIINNNI